MLTLLMYAVCAIVFFQGVALFQRMLVETMPPGWRRLVIWIGALGFVMATFFSAALAYQFTLQANQAAEALAPMLR